MAFESNGSTPNTFAWHVFGASSCMGMMDSSPHNTHNVWQTLQRVLSPS